MYRLQLDSCWYSNSNWILDMMLYGRCTICLLLEKFDMPQQKSTMIRSHALIIGPKKSFYCPITFFKLCLSPPLFFLFPSPPAPVLQHPSTPTNDYTVLLILLASGSSFAAPERLPPNLVFLFVVVVLFCQHSSTTAFPFPFNFLPLSPYFACK